MKRRWKVSRSDAGLEELFRRELNVAPLTARLLVNRGFADAGKASSFLRPDIRDLHDPFLMKDMDRAADRVRAAVVSGERIAVYGDYDVDGTTAASLLHVFLRESGVAADVYLPDRKKEGYGLNAEAVKKLAASGVRLVITVDCGASNHDEIALASSLSMDVIVTDHHEFPAKKGVPAAHAVLNPRRGDCPFPFKGLAGAGVAFNLAMAARSRLRAAGWYKKEEPNLKRLTALAAIGTVTDMVPLLDENRIIVSAGLKELMEPRSAGLRALKNASNLRPDRTPDADTIAFQLGPRINAAGRVGHAMTAFSLLTTRDDVEAARLAEELNAANARRQEIEETTLREALAMIGRRPAGKGIVLHSRSWHPGVIGIVASRLVERFSVPAVMIAVEDGVGKGSARGIRALDLLAALSASSAALARFGGHKAAAGITVEEGNIERFKREFLATLDAMLTEADLVPEMALDAVVSLKDIDLKLVSEIRAMEPFGVANRAPVFCLTGASVTESEVVKDRHLRLRLRQSGATGAAIGFNMAAMHPVRGDGYALAFSPYLDEWNGQKSAAMRVRDVKRMDEVNILT